MTQYKSVVPGEVPVPQLHGLLLGSINPRPIAFVSTVDESGNRNLAPFSFFNVFGANPPIVAFSPARRGRDNTTKDTYENLKKLGECTVNIVSYDMVHQMVLASSEYASDQDEFVRAGFTPLKSDVVQPVRVAESPSQMECVVKEIINYGEVAGGGNLIIAEVVKLHVKSEVLDENGKVDPFKIDTVGRCGGAWYTRPKDALFSIGNPKGKDNIGFDKIPDRIKNSSVLTGNDLGQLGKWNALPNREEVVNYLMANPELKSLVNEGAIEQRLHTIAKKHIENGDIEGAWKVLMANKVQYKTMAVIKVLGYEEAEGPLKEIYDHLIETRGKLAEVHKIQSLNPPTIMQHMDLYMGIMFGQSPVKRYQREMMAVVVSKANECEYCQLHHAEALNHYWKNDEKVALLEKDFQAVGLSDVDRAYCQMAWNLTKNPGSSVDGAFVKPLKELGIGDREILDATLVIAYFNFVNRIVLNLNVTPSKEEVSGYDY